MAARADLADALTRHQVFVQRLATGEANKFSAFLKRMDRELRARLAGDDLTEFTRSRLERLLEGVDEMLTEIFGEHTRAMLADLQEFAKHEASFTARALSAAVDFEAVVPAVTQVRAAVLTNPLAVRGADGGKLLRSFVRDWSSAERRAVVGAIRQGAFEGQTNNQIVQALRGTKALRYEDGLLSTTNRHARAVVRTAVQHVSTAARQETYRENEDIIERVIWVSTLDKRTCPRCGALDGRPFPIDSGPRPPLHPQCRCTTRPELAAKYRDLRRGATRASKGAEGGTPVDAELSYYEWLKKQPPAFQNEAIGAARAKLLRDGGLSASRFAQLQLDKNFAPMTLEEMIKLEPLAFERAGVEP